MMGRTNRLVGDEMMDVVAALPPPNGQAAAKVGNEHADECVYSEDLRDGSMASIVSREHDLMLFIRVSCITCRLGGK